MLLVFTDDLYTVNCSQNVSYIAVFIIYSPRTNLCVLQVEIDMLTGETTILQADIIYDCGQSMNPAVDMGQVANFNYD